MTEGELLAQIQLAHSRGDTRLLRINTGMAWQGRVVESTPERIILAHPRAIHLGHEGLSDLVGWSAGGLFTAIEAKIHPRKPTDAQRRFIELVLGAGGRAGVAYSVDDAARILISGR